MTFFTWEIVGRCDAPQLRRKWLEKKNIEKTRAVPPFLVRSFMKSYEFTWGDTLTEARAQSKLIIYGLCTRAHVLPDLASQPSRNQTEDFAYLSMYYLLRCLSY